MWPVISALSRNHARVSGALGATPIVFAHGFGCDQSMWTSVASSFESDHSVITYDHAGFGGTDLGGWDEQRHTSIEAYADDLLELIHDLDLHDVVFVGHSVASMIGVLASIKEPDRFGQLVLVGPSPRYIDDPATGYVGGFSQADIDELLATLDENYLGWSRQMAPVIMGNSDRPGLGRELTESFCRVPTPVARSFARVTFLSDNRDDLARVTVPTLILQCRDDPIAGEPVGRYVHAQIAGSTLVHLDATGHCPNLSAPDETAAAIRAHLGQQPTDRPDSRR
jgi:sigma-B regulation protein RsbQ